MWCEFDRFSKHLTLLWLIAPGVLLIAWAVELEAVLISNASVRHENVTCIVINEK